MKGNNRFDVKVLDRKTGFEKIEKLWVPAGYKTPKMSATKISQPPLSTTKTKNIKVKHPHAHESSLIKKVLMKFDHNWEWNQGIVVILIC